MSISPDSFYDAVIVGAGPAGSVVSILLARAGWRVALLERSAWPRDKVCGGCVNAAGVAMLQTLGLSHVLSSSLPMTHLSLNVRGRLVDVPLRHGAGIARSDLDARLVSAAVANGVMFLPQTSATLLPVAATTHREITTTIGTLRTRLAIAADGIAGTLLAHEPWANWQIAWRARFGVATTLQSDALPPHAIGMNVGVCGYVGTARLPSGELHIAAALDPAACRDQGGPTASIAAILRSCNHPLGDVDLPPFRGTPLLTRRRPTLGGQRILAVGDACGYVEPFTGEGIAWAIRSAIELAGLLVECSPVTWREELVPRWNARYHAAVGRQQRLCGVLRHLVRHPSIFALSAYLPFVAQHVAGQVGRPISVPFEGVPL